MLTEPAARDLKTVGSRLTLHGQSCKLVEAQRSCRLYVFIQALLLLQSLHSWLMKSWCLMVEEVQQAFHDNTGQKSSLCSTLSHLASSSCNVQKPDPCKICPDGILREQMTSKRKEGCFMASSLFLPVDFGRSDWTFCSQSPQQKGYRAE